MKRFYKFLSILLQFLIMLVLPFWLIMRGTIFLYKAYDWPFVGAILVMGLVVGVLLLIYVAMVWDAVFGANKISRSTLKGQVFFVLVLMLGYVGYTFFNMSAANAKGEAVKKEFSSLHPMLRLAVGTFIFLDDGLLVTDMSRQQSDYADMGLKTNKKSLHYKQPSGFVHAMDLRTKGRSEFRNKLLQGYFWAMGFQTLRHGGTADHLHVSLYSKHNPGAI